MTRWRVVKRVSPIIIMDAKTTLSISEARKRIFEIAEKVQKPDVHYTLTENGRPKAVIMSVEEFESWKETIEVMHDIPDLKKDIEEAERYYKSGAYKNYSTLEEILAKEGFVSADKAKKRYGASSRFQAKRVKTTRKNSKRL